MENCLERVKAKESGEITAIELNKKVTKQSILSKENCDVSMPQSYDLKKEEEFLCNQIKELKKENFSLQKSINAWQHTLGEKLQDLKNTDVKLNGLYKEIWSERENFCSEADKFNDEMGVLSEWWNTQMKIVSDFENLRQKRLEEKQCNEEIEILQKEVEKLKEKMDLESTKRVVEVEVHMIQPNESGVEVNDTSEELSVEDKVCCEKRLRFSDNVEIIEPETNLRTRVNELFALMNIDHVRLANRRRQQLNNKNPFISKVKKFLK